MGTLGQGGRGKKLRYWDGVCAQTQHQLLRIASYVYTHNYIFLHPNCLLVCCLGGAVGPPRCFYHCASESVWQISSSLVAVGIGLSLACRTPTRYADMTTCSFSFCKVWDNLKIFNILSKKEYADTLTYPINFCPKNRLRIRGVSPLLLLITCEFFPPKWLKMSFESKGLTIGQRGLKGANKSWTWSNQGWKW